MIFLVFKFVLPLLMGYALFVGITGRLNPLGYPEDETLRKPWFQGIMAGATVCITFTLYIHIAYTVPATAFSTFLIPASTVAITLFALWIATGAIMKRSRNNISGKTIQDTPQKTQARTQGLPKLPGNSSVQRKLAISSASSKVTDLQKSHPVEVSPAYMRNANVEHLNLHAQTAINDTVDIYLALDEVVGSSYHGYDQQAPDTERGHHLKLVSDTSATGNSGETSGLHADKSSPARPDSELAKNLKTLQIAIALEKVKRQGAEKQSTTLKRLLVNAKLDIKRCNVARAKALSTANKSIAFARQTVEVRGRLEQELQLAKRAIVTSHKTISDLQLALQKIDASSRMTGEYSSSGRNSLPGKDQEMHAPVRTSEKGKKLTSGLVKKVARSRSAAEFNTQLKPAQQD